MERERLVGQFEGARSRPGSISEAEDAVQEALLWTFRAAEGSKQKTGRTGRS